jgi:hypothetical protein
MLHRLFRHFVWALLVALIAGCGDSQELEVSDSTPQQSPGRLSGNIYQEARSATYTADQQTGTLRLRNALQAVRISADGDIVALSEQQQLAALRASASVELLTTPEQGSQRFVTGRISSARVEGSDLILQLGGVPQLPATLGEVLLLGPEVLPVPSAEILGQVTSQIKGKVTVANNGEPLPGTIVKVSGTRLEAVTNGDGFYVFPLVQPGSYQVVASFPGFQTQTQAARVMVAQPATVNFALESLLSSAQTRIVQQAPEGRLELGQAGRATLTLLQPFSPSLVDSRGEARKLSLSDLESLVGASETGQKVELLVLGPESARSESITLLEVNLGAVGAVFEVLLSADSLLASGDLGQVIVSVTR